MKQNIVKILIGYPIVAIYALVLVAAMPFIFLWMWLNDEITTETYD